MAPILRRSDAPGPDVLRPPEPGILYYNESAKLMTSAVGPIIGRNRLPNQLPTMLPESKSGCTTKAFEVPARKRWGRKPADSDGFAGKPLRRAR